MEKECNHDSNDDFEAPLDASKAAGEVGAQPKRTTLLPDGAEEFLPSAARVTSNAVPSPLLNQIGRTIPKEGYSLFDCETIGEDQRARYHYKAIDPIDILVPYNDVSRAVDVSEQTATWRPATQLQGGSHSDLLRTWIGNDVLPDHIALTFSQRIEVSYQDLSNTRGRPRKHDLIVGYQGFCSARKEHECPTCFFIGFTETALRSMLREPKPESVTLSIKIIGSCIHIKGVSYGQLRGAPRHHLISQFAKARKTPAEFTKDQYSSNTGATFHTGNHASKITRTQAWNISREAAQRQRKEKGLTGCSISNVYRVDTLTREKDTASRAAIGDDSKDMLGILRRHDLLPSFRAHLYTKQMLQIFYALSQTGRLIISVDSTGGMISLPHVNDMKGKILHTKIVLSPKYPVLAGPEFMQDSGLSGRLSPLTVAEMVSNRNKAGDMADFFNAFRRDAHTVFSNSEMISSPLLVLTDVSPALQKGALMAFSSSHNQDITRHEYCNVVLMLLLNYDWKVANCSQVGDGACDGMAIGDGHDVNGNQKTAIEADLLVAAKFILSELRETYKIKIALKECKSHVYRAPVHWIGVMAAKYGNVKQERDRLTTIMKKSFSNLLTCNHISENIVRLCLLIAMLNTERFSCKEVFSVTSTTKEHKGDTEIATELKMVQEVEQFVATEAAKLHVKSKEDVAATLQSLDDFSKVALVVYKDTMHRAKAFMVKQCCIYLRSVTTDNDDCQRYVGVLKMSIIYGSGFSGEDGTLEAWKEGGLEIAVKLPFDGKGGIKNPLFLPLVANYLQATWLDRAPWWSRGIIDVLERAMDMKIESSNQLSEGVFRTAKHDQDVQNHLKEPADYYLNRWDDTMKCCCEFANQYQELGASIAMLKLRRKKRKQRDPSASSLATDVTAVTLTQDELTHHQEEEVGEQWCRTGSTNERDGILRNKLISVLDEVAPHARRNNKGRHTYLTHWFLNVMPPPDHPAFFGYQNFNKWMNNSLTTKKGLGDEQRDLLNHFIEKNDGAMRPTESASMNAVDRVGV